MPPSLGRSRCLKKAVMEGTHKKMKTFSFLLLSLFLTLSSRAETKQYKKIVDVSEDCYGLLDIEWKTIGKKISAIRINNSNYLIQSCQIISGQPALVTQKVSFQSKYYFSVPASPEIKSDHDVVELVPDEAYVELRKIDSKCEEKRLAEEKKISALADTPCADISHELRY